MAGGAGRVGVAAPTAPKRKAPRARGFCHLSSNAKFRFHCSHILSQLVEACIEAVELAIQERKPGSALRTGALHFPLELIKPVLSDISEFIDGYLFSKHNENFQFL